VESASHSLRSSSKEEKPSESATGAEEVGFKMRDGGRYDIRQIFDGVSPIKELDPTSNQKIFEYSCEQEVEATHFKMEESVIDINMCDG
jgi:hypothetical protein